MTSSWRRNRRHPPGKRSFLVSSTAAHVREKYVAISFLRLGVTVVRNTMTATEMRAGRARYNDANDVLQ